jgi:hypothetical protein
MGFPEVSNTKAPGDSEFPFGASLMLVMCVHTWNPKTPGIMENGGAHFLPAVPSRDAESPGTALNEK